MKNGSVTVLPEYNGSLLAYLDPKAKPKTVEETTTAIKAKLDSKLTLLKPSPAAEQGLRDGQRARPRRSTS